MIKANLAEMSDILDVIGGGRPDDNGRIRQLAEELKSKAERLATSASRSEIETCQREPAPFGHSVHALRQMRHTLDLEFPF